MNSEQIVERLDILISLMIPYFDESKYPIKGLGLDILRLSDGTNSVEDMTKKLKKTRATIEPLLTKLRGMHLLKSITKDSKTYYIRLK